MQQRQVSPIPPGRYWIVTTSRADAEDFRRWARDMQGAAVIEHAEIINTGNFPTTGHVFFIFSVPPGRSPFLNAQQFGFPDVAPPSVREHQDIRDTPDLSFDVSTDVIAPLKDLAAEAARNAAAAAGDAAKAAVPFGLLVVLVLLFLNQHGRRAA
jgi:hypothetical protein